MIRALAALALVSLAACGTPAKDRNVLAPQVAERVALYEEGQPAPEGAEVLGTVVGQSCKRYMWHPAPTREVALTELRMNAMAIGADAIIDVKQNGAVMNLVDNCWAEITLTGTAVALE